MVDNHDSFTYNIVDMLLRNGVEVDVFTNDNLPDTERAAKYGSLVISPGPGNPLKPTDRGGTLELISKVRFDKILGICFGHQLLGYHLGSSVYRTANLYHGEIDRIENLGGGLLKGLPHEFNGVRYHSLAITPAPGMIVDSISQTDGTIMAFHTDDEKIFGLQFHPESHYSEFGETIIRRFISYGNSSRRNLQAK